MRINFAFLIDLEKSISVRNLKFNPGFTALKY